MSFECKKCLQTLSSQRALDGHDRRKVPCDRVCPKCNFKAKDRHQYYRHQQAHLRGKIESDSDEADEADEDEVEEITPTYIKLPQKEDDRLVPIQDYSLVSVVSELSKVANAEDVDIVLIHPRKRNLAERAAQSFQTCDYAHSLTCFNRDINEVAAEVLNSLHGDPQRPELHSIRMGDHSRKIVKIYTRPTIDVDASWMPYGRVASLNALTEHAKNILSFTFKRGVLALEYRFCVVEQCVCYCLHDGVKGRNLIIVDGNEFDDPDRLMLFAQAGAPPYLKVLFYPGELIDLPEEYEDNAINLGLFIQQRTDEVLKQIKHLELTEHDVSLFLEKTRRPLTMTSTQ